MKCGKSIRMSRLIHSVSGRSVIVPMDHGATMGPIQGLVNLRDALTHLCSTSTTALLQGLVLHRGSFQRSSELLPAHSMPPRILHVSSSTNVNPVSGGKAQVAWVEDALQMGADAISIHVNLGVEQESVMMRDFGALASACQRWGMPLLCMIYVRVQGQTSNRVEHVKLAARVAAETGADLIKVSYPGSIDAMHEVTDGCFAPVLIAGGDKSDSEHSVLQMVRDAMAGGAAGVCMGRNLFQADDVPRFMRSVADVVHSHVVTHDESPLDSRAVLNGASGHLSNAPTRHVSVMSL
jgi:predicted phospho-2-dehydro-3-deoxyheptonate aldolase